MRLGTRFLPLLLLWPPCIIIHADEHASAPLLPLPATILLHAGIDYTGQTIPVACCGDVQVDDSYEIASVRIAPVSEREHAIVVQHIHLHAHVRDMDSHGMRCATTLPSCRYACDMLQGLQLHLFSEPTCTGLSLRTTINVASITQHHVELAGHIRCLRLLRLAPDSGCIVWQHEHEQGEGQMLLPGRERMGGGGRRHMVRVHSN